MTEAPLRVHETTAPVPLIELRNIHKTFVTGGDVEVHALRGVSLSIYPGEFVAIVGASGSGKSTLMNLIGCLDHASSGVYAFAGRDVSRLDPDALAWLRREAFGFVFQSYHLIATLTAAENVEIPAIYAGKSAPERHARALKLLATLGMHEREHHRPNQLSGGQQQRVSVARALMNGGQIILADEPTGALDSKSGADVLALLKSLAEQGHTIIIITHDASVAAHARRHIEIRDGLIVSDTGPDPVSNISTDTSPDPESVATVSPLSELTEAVHLAFRSLRANLFRTVLTLLGIVIGVGSVVAMLAVGEGAKQEVLNRIGSMGTNLLQIRPGAPNQRGSQIATLVKEDAAAIAALPNIQAAIPEYAGGVTARAGDLDADTQANGTTPDLPTIRSWPVAWGTFFSKQDMDSYSSVAVLGQTVLANLYPDGSDPVGKYILLNNVPFQVIGILSAKGAGSFGNDNDDVVMVPLTTAMLRLFGQRYVRSITVAVADVSEIDATQDAVTNLLRGRHKAEDFRIRNMAEVVETASAAQNTLTVLLGSVAAISLLVGGIGVMNIMLVSVTERTREIGIRMATGARTRDILHQFLTEATIVSAFGGVIGVIGGIATALVIAAFGPPVVFSVGPSLLAFGCAALTGLIFGFAPAHKAARLDPVVALASE